MNNELNEFISKFISKPIDFITYLYENYTYYEREDSYEYWETYLPYDLSNKLLITLKVMLRVELESKGDIYYWNRGKIYLDQLIVELTHRITGKEILIFEETNLVVGSLGTRNSPTQKNWALDEYVIKRFLMTLLEHLQIKRIKEKIQQITFEKV